MTFANLTELYLTLLGWNFYDSLWQGFSETGAAYVPFLVMVIKNFHDGYRARPGDGAEQSVTAMELSVGTMLFVIVFIATPIPGSLDAGKITAWITPPTLACGTASGTGSNSGPSAGAVMDSTVAVGGGSAVGAPLWWLGVMSLSGGFNRGLMGVFDCTLDLREMRQAAASVNIADNALRNEYNQFFSQCYVPAKSKFDSESMSLSSAGVQPIVSNFFGTNGQKTEDDWLSDDVHFLGSRTFLGLPGYYDSLQAMKPVEGFSASSGGTVGPNCKDWWEGGSGGTSLRDRLADQASDISDWFTRAKNEGISATFKAYWGDDEVNKDNAIRVLQNRDPPEYTGEGLGSSTGKGTKILVGTAAVAALAFSSTARDIASSAAAEYAGLQATMYLIRESAPIVQAVTLMAIYAFLPVLLVFSGYSFGAIWLGSVAIFTVKFWSVLWAMAYWIDGHLTELMYPDGSHFLTPGPLFESALLDIISMGLYVGLPFLFTIVLGWAGSQVGNEMNRVGGQMYGGASKMGGGVAAKTAKKL